MYDCAVNELYLLPFTDLNGRYGGFFVATRFADFMKVMGYLNNYVVELKTHNHFTARHLNILE